MEDIRRMEDETQRELEAVGIFKLVRPGGRSPGVVGSLLGGSRDPLVHHGALEGKVGHHPPLENYRERTTSPFFGWGRESLKLETLMSSRTFLGSCFS